MKIIYVLAFIFLAVFLILTGVVGLAGITVSHVLAVIINLLAVASGVLFLIGAGKCCCHDDKCMCSCHDRKPEEFNRKM